VDNLTVAHGQRRSRQDGWPWLDLLDEQRKAQHHPRAKDMKARLLPLQFVVPDASAEDDRKRAQLEAYSRVRMK
jgi:hypothetical protein